MKTIDNITVILKDDLMQTIHPGSKVSIAAVCFSIYAFQELKNQLEQIEECRFLFTAPTFVKEKIKKEKREFFIPRLNRERSIYGTEFEVRLRNQLTQKAIAKECAEWIKRKVRFLSNTTDAGMQNYYVVDDSVYMPVDGFTTVDLGTERGNVAMNTKMRFDAPESRMFIEQFDRVWNDPEQLQDVTDEVLDMISTVYQENAPELIYFVALYNIFSEFLEDLDEDNLPNDRTGFKNSLIWNKLYNFQKDAALGIIQKLEQYNGCILADSVGLGKTFTALAVIKYYESRNKTVLVLCPKKLADNWNTYRDNYVNNPIAGDRLNYKVLFHTDLSRERGNSNGTDLARLNWGNYDLVVIDESHNFRNGEGTHANTHENRYIKLMNKVIKTGVKTKVLMLSATPVNNRFLDLRNQLALAYEGESADMGEKIGTKSPIENVFTQAQRAFNSWSKLEPKLRTTEELQKRLDFDFFKVLDSVTIARSRKHVQQYYDMSEIGSFPDRLPPIPLRPKLTTLKNACTYTEIVNQLLQLNLHIYTPTAYILPTKILKYLDEEEDPKLQKGREMGIRRLMAINLLKRMESSVHSFCLTIERISHYISSTVSRIEALKSGDVSCAMGELLQLHADTFDEDDQNTEAFCVGSKLRIDLRDMDYLSWERSLREDLNIFNRLNAMVRPIVPEVDYKLIELKQVIANKQRFPINAGNKKVLIFTAFADTADYLYEHIAPYMKDNYGLNTAMISGSKPGQSTIRTLPKDMNMILSCFSPISKERDAVYPHLREDIDILIATDCISEGQNLQDCDYCINYDIHWNPVRIIQRFGRIDRIGSKNEVIQLVNFWPDVELDEYIKLKGRVETRMKAVVMTSTGDDDYINAEEKGDLEYRKQQLHRLMNEVVDIEEMAGGINIMDLGLNEFRMDLLAYRQQHPEIDHVPFGIHAVVEGEKPGVIFVLKNINPSINIENQNRLHPFYMVYISDDGEVIWDHLHAKELLDTIRLMARGKNEPDRNLCRIFNKETKDGRYMQHVSELLQEAIGSIIHVKEESDIDSFFSGEQTSFLTNEVRGLEDFELICFMVVRHD